jgi:hypothetical protein
MPSPLPIPRPHYPSVRSHWKAALSLALALHPAIARPQQLSLIEKVAANEVAARQQRLHFSYLAEERSVRTDGHLWKENVVETNDGPLRRLIAVDNKPLTPAEAQTEQRRIDDLVAHPNEFRKLNQAHKDDEERATQLLQLLSSAFVLTPAGEANGCLRFTFQTKPDFEPASYQERVAREMTGTVSVRRPDDRLCTLEATIVRPVDFGFGVIGHIDQGGHFSIDRKQIDAKNWKSARIAVHVNGRILMLKSLAQDQETVRTQIRIVPQNLTLAQAAQLTRQ